MREVIPTALAGERVDRVVALLTGLPRTDASRLVESGAVLIDGRPASARSRRVNEGEVLEVHVPEVTGAARPEPDASLDVRIVHEDESVVVVDKAAGVVVHPGAGTTGPTLVNALLARFPEIAEVGDAERPGVVHRLDKGTSGLLVVARSPAAYASLVDQLGRRTVDRRYLALVWGHLESPSGLVDAPVGRARRDRTRMAVSAGGRDARTRYDVLDRFTSYRTDGRGEPREVRVDVTLLECRLETGRTHQIRVHLSAIGHPVVGDARYGGARQSIPCVRPFLHAHRLSFDHPATGRRVAFESPLPHDLAQLRERLSG